MRLVKRIQTGSVIRNVLNRIWCLRLEETAVIKELREGGTLELMRLKRRWSGVVCARHRRISDRYWYCNSQHVIRSTYTSHVHTTSGPPASVSTPACPLVWPSVHPSARPTIRPSVSQSVSYYACLSISQYARLPAHLSIPPSIGLSAPPSVRRSIRPSIGPPIHPSVRPSVRPSIHPSIRPPIHPSAHPSVCPSIHTFLMLSLSSSSAPTLRPCAHARRAPCTMFPTWTADGVTSGGDAQHHVSGASHSNTLTQPSMTETTQQYRYTTINNRDNTTIPLHWPREQPTTKDINYWQQPPTINNSHYWLIIANDVWR